MKKLFKKLLFWILDHQKKEKGWDIFVLKISHEHYDDILAKDGEKIIIQLQVDDEIKESILCYQLLRTKNITFIPNIPKV